MATKKTFEELRFDNSYARLPQGFYAKLNPTPFTSPPYLVHANPAAAELIDLDPDQFSRPEAAGLFGGSLLVPGMEPLAMLYSGHQFGIYVPQLGDGRAILLGEATNERGEQWDLHLKGAGMTPFSRDGDGRAVLRSTIREYLCCAAMQGLGIPTTQALCLVGSDDKVYRERVETGAMLVRMAPSHVRFGTFEVFYYRNQYENLKVLADYVIDRHFPHLSRASDKYASFFMEVAERTARLIARWQSVGWAHGVMNTDNMSILGLTLDYGPYGFMDEYDAGFICNHSDHNGRYAFNQQPSIGLWNLGRLAQALRPLVEKEALKSALDAYTPVFEEEYRSLMRKKLGLVEARDQDDELVRELLGLIQESRADYTIVFRELGTFRSDVEATNDRIREHTVNRERFNEWASLYRERLQSEHSRDEERCIRMDQVNPKYVLRNYLAQTAIEKAQEKDFSEVGRLFDLLTDPFNDQPGLDAYAGCPPNWGKHIAVSCSS